MLPVALNLHNRSVLLVGGGEEALDKLPKLLRVGARVTLVASELTPELRELVLARRVPWYARALHPSDLEGVHLVMLTEPDRALAERVRSLKGRHGFWLCAIDQPALSDVFLVSTLTRGPVHIGISTGGQAPLLARHLRRALACALDEEFSEFARKFAELRAHIRALPKQQRKERLEAALNGFAMEVRLSYPAGNPPGQASSGGGQKS